MSFAGVQTKRVCTHLFFWSFFLRFVLSGVWLACRHIVKLFKSLCLIVAAATF